MKKYLDLCLLGAATLFSALIFAFMALPAATLKGGNIVIKSDSLYKCLDEGLVVVSFIFMILALLVAACLCAVALLKTLNKSKAEVPYAQFIALGAALLALVACILYFVFPGANDLSMGAGSVLCALCAMFTAFALGAYGALKLLKK